MITRGNIIRKAAKYGSVVSMHLARLPVYRSALLGGKSSRVKSTCAAAEAEVKVAAQQQAHHL